jgi:choline dehydrogenase-like flavoprotein
VERVEFATLGGKKGAVRARHYVICCGGIETARVMLASNRVQPHGIGNQNDLVGRCFQEHVHFNFGRLFTGHRKHLQDLFESFFVHGLKHAPLITLTQRMQEEKKLLSVHGMVVFEPAADSGIAAMKKLFRAAIGRSFSNEPELRRLLGKSLSNPGEALRLAYRLKMQKRAATPQDGPILFGAQCEMAPNPDSRVSLGEKRDALGMPRLKLDWRLGDLERRTLLEFIGALAAEFARLGLGTFDLQQAADLEDPTAWIERAHDSAHHMGTARMHEDPRFGVVDSQCQRALQPHAHHSCAVSAARRPAETGRIVNLSDRNGA